MACHDTASIDLKDRDAVTVTDFGSRERKATSGISDAAAVEALWPVEMAEGNIVKARRKDVRRYRVRAADQNPALGAFTLNATRAVEVPSGDKGQIIHDLFDGCNDFGMEGPCCGLNAEPGLCV